MMNPAYARTISRHRVLLSIPIVLTTVVALWFVVGKPNAYLSTASLWVDNPAPEVPYTGSDITVLPPAANAQQVLNELLTTRHFRVTVGHGGPLAGYLEAHPSQGWGPSALLAGLRGGGSLSDRLQSALDVKHVSTTVAGPQVLAVSLRGPTPAVAAGTLKALVTEFNRERKSLEVARQRANVSYWQAQVKAASSAVDKANNDLYVYNSGGSSDQPVKALKQALRIASTRLTKSRTNFHLASVSSAATRGEQGPLAHVIDPPLVPTAPVSGRKRAVFALVAGLFVGGLLSLLGVIALSSEEREQRLARAGDQVRRLLRSLSGEASQVGRKLGAEFGAEAVRPPPGEGAQNGAATDSNSNGSGAHAHRPARVRSKTKARRRRR